VRKFECIRCGKCCDHLLSFKDGFNFGLYLSPKESELFPKEIVLPLFRYESEIIAYQVGVDSCPHLSCQNELCFCKIYDQRPLTCRVFPMVSPVEMAEIICPVTSPFVHEEWDLSNMQDSLDAFKEQEMEADALPYATAMYLIDKKIWLEY
jgi:Fe-S-cluster containining protein